MFFIWVFNLHSNQNYIILSDRIVKLAYNIILISSSLYHSGTWMLVGIKSVPIVSPYLNIKNCNCLLAESVNFLFDLLSWNKIINNCIMKDCGVVLNVIL